jgi:4-amino-4-deoxy-L-arabinose transferase-like glycosyltransferase
MVCNTTSNLKSTNMISATGFEKILTSASRPLFFYIVVFLVGFIPLFYNLGGPVLNHWDESRNAAMAFEMLHNGDLIVTHYDGEPEMWGTKPPLLIWTQALCFKAFGFSEFALRFPVAVSAMLLAMLLLWFCGTYFRSYLLGLVSALILFTTTAIISVHGARSGDYDLPLILFTTASILFLFLSTEYGETKEGKRYILLFFIAFTLAVLTKGIAAFLLAPGMLVYLLISKNLLTWLKSRNFWIGLALLLLLFGGYYLLREIRNPGYFRAVLENEMTGRYFETLEENEGPFIYYIRGIYQWRFRDWFYLVPIGVLLGYWTKDRKITRFLNLSLVVTALYILIISASKTKLEWYDLPVYPFLIIMAALFFHIVLTGMKGENSVIASGWGRTLVTAALLFFFFITPYYHVFKQNRDETAFRQDETYRFSHYLRGLRGQMTGGSLLNVIQEGDKQQYLFYFYRLEEDGAEINLVDPANISEGRQYIVHQPEVLERLQLNPHLQIEALSDGIFSVTLDDQLPGDTR